MILQLASNVDDMLRSYMGNFVKTEVITAARDVTVISLKEVANQKPDDDMTVAVQAMRYLNSLSLSLSQKMTTHRYPCCTARSTLTESATNSVQRGILLQGAKRPTGIYNAAEMC